MKERDAGRVLRLSRGFRRSEEGSRKHFLRRIGMVTYQIQLHRRPVKQTWRFVLLLQEEVKKWKGDQKSFPKRCQGSL
jgi:hypothetical protein